MTLRAATATVFAVLAAAVATIAAAGILLAATIVAEYRGLLFFSLLTFGGGSLLLIVAMVAGVWAYFHLRLVRPLAALRRNAETAVDLDTGASFELAGGHLAQDLARAVKALADGLRDSRSEVRDTVAGATARLNETKNRLEAILLDLSEGVVACSKDHRIQLYNLAAARILAAPEMLGLGRPLFGAITREPILHTLERLDHRYESGRRSGDELTEPFVCATTDSRLLLLGRMTLVRDAGQAVTGYILTFSDASGNVDALARRDTLLRAATEGMRAPLANIRAAAETLASFPDLEADRRAGFERVISLESAALSERLETLADDSRRLTGGRWPLADIHSVDLFACVVRHLGEAGVAVTMTGTPHWLRGDSHSLMVAIEFLIDRIREQTGATGFDLEAESKDRLVYVDIVWRGEPVPAGTLDGWLEHGLAGAIGAATLLDVLERHESELWSEPHRRGEARLRFPLSAGSAAPPREVVPPRPEFYDFELIDTAGDRGEQPLRALSCVVFDTETTGLQPSQGDQLVAIGGVRVVNGRVLTGETFERLINPGIAIPKLSIRFHGITDDMVADKPPARIVLPQFHRFVEGAVLVAHNAAFDMKFLELKSAESGADFDNPVLDLLLLSAFLHDHVADHSLDSLAGRFSVEVEGRHTALGDAMTTAGIFVQMLDLLESRGIRTLNQALEAADSMVEIRRRQARF
jgi:DNA polymerase-3 subunit epsilon